MSTRLLPRSLRNALTGVVLAVSLRMLVGSSANTVQAAAGNTYVVNSAADTPDADVANPTCADDN